MQATSHERDVLDVLDVVRNYGEFIYTGHLDLFDAIFHPDFHMAGFRGGVYAQTRRDAYRDAVASRPSPASANAPRCNDLLSLDLSSGDMACVKVRVQLHSTVFIDYLTLVRTEGAWTIVSKTYESVAVSAS